MRNDLDLGSEHFPKDLRRHSSEIINRQRLVREQRELYSWVDRLMTDSSVVASYPQFCLLYEPVTFTT